MVARMEPVRVVDLVDDERQLDEGPGGAPGRERRGLGPHRLADLDANCSDRETRAYTKGKFPYTLVYFATGALLLQTTACWPPLCPRCRLAAARESDTAY